MKQTIKSILAFAAVLLCGGVWANTVQIWDGTFDGWATSDEGSTYTKTIEGVAYTLSMNGHTYVENGAHSYLLISENANSEKKGVTLTRGAASSATGATIIIDYSNYGFKAGKPHQIPLMIHGNKNEYGNTQDVFATQGGKMLADWADFYNNNNGTSYSSVTTAESFLSDSADAEVVRGLAVTYSNGNGAYAFQRNYDNLWREVFKKTDLAGRDTYNILGFAIGGLYEPSKRSNASVDEAKIADGMKVYSISVDYTPIRSVSGFNWTTVTTPDYYSDFNYSLALQEKTAGSQAWNEGKTEPTYYSVRGDGANGAAVMSNNTWPTLTGHNASGDFSYLTVAKLASSGIQIIGNVSDAVWEGNKNGLSLVFHDNKVKLVNWHHGTQNANESITDAMVVVSSETVDEAWLKQYHSFLVVYKNTGTQAKLFIDGELVGTDWVNLSNRPGYAAWSVGRLHGGTGRLHFGEETSTLDYSTGMRVDAVAFWKSDMSESAAAIATKYPVWTDEGYVAQVGATGYTTLSAAVTAAGANEVVEILSSCTDAVTLTKNVTFKVDGNVTLTGKISGAFSVTKTGNGILTFSNTSNDFSGGLYVKSGTVKGNTLGNAKNQNIALDNQPTVHVSKGATLDIGDTNGYSHKINLAGSLTATTGISNTSRQTESITLTDDALVFADVNFGLLAHSYRATALNLGTYTLTVNMSHTSNNNFWFVSGVAAGTGTLYIEKGKLACYGGGNPSGGGDCSIENGTLSVGKAGEIVLAAKQLKVKNLKLVPGAKIQTNNGATKQLIVTGMMDISAFTTYTTAVVGAAGASAVPFKVENTTRFRFPAGLAADTPFTLCTGTLDAPASVSDAVCYIGDTPKIVNLSYDTTNKTVSYSVVRDTVRTIYYKGTGDWNSTRKFYNSDAKSEEELTVMLPGDTVNFWENDNNGEGKVEGKVIFAAHDLPALNLSVEAGINLIIGHNGDDQSLPNLPENSVITIADGGKAYFAFWNNTWTYDIPMGDVEINGGTFGISPDNSGKVLKMGNVTGTSVLEVAVGDSVTVKSIARQPKAAEGKALITTLNDDGTTTYTAGNPVAKIGSDLYASLSDAMSAAQAAGATAENPIEVTVLSSISDAVEIPEYAVVFATFANRITGALSGSGTYKIINTPSMTTSDSWDKTIGNWFGAGSLTSFNGTLWMARGRFQITESIESGRVALKVTDGAQLYVKSGTISNPIEISGNGMTFENNDTKYQALRIDGATYSGTITAVVTGEGDSKVVPRVGTHNATNATITGDIIAPDGIKLQSTLAAGVITISTIKGSATDTSVACAVEKVGAGEVKVKNIGKGDIKITSGTFRLNEAKVAANVNFEIASGAKLNCYGWPTFAGAWSIKTDATIDGVLDNTGNNPACIRTGAFTKKGTGAITMPLYFGNGDGADNYKGSITVEAGELIIGQNSYFDSTATLSVASGATLSVANGKTVGGTGSISIAAGGKIKEYGTSTVNGVLKGAGEITGDKFAFGNTTTIDVTEGVLTATAPVSFAGAIKVNGVTNNGDKVLTAHGLRGFVEVQNVSGEKLGYLAETAEGIVLTTSEPTDHYDLTAEEVTELNLAAMTTGEIKYYTAQGVILAQNATINFPEGETGYYAWTAGGPEIFIAKKTKSVSIKMNPRRAGEGHIAATDDSVGGFPVAGVFWNHTKDYANNGAGTTELMTGIKDGTGATLSDTKVYYYMPNSYTVNKTDNAGNAIINGRDKQITGNGKLTFSYFDDTVRTTPSSWPYTVLTDNGTPYTIPRTPSASESAAANLGWCVAIQGMPYQVFDLYIYQASDQTAESITLLPIAVKANNGEWQYFAGDNKGSTIKTTINATWDGAPYCDSKEMTEGKNYIRYRISRATLGLADSEEIETIYLSHPSRTSYSGRLGLAGIQIVEVENDGFYNRKADADNQDGEGHVKTNWTEAQTWLNSSGSPINWPTTKETAYVNINADTVAEITVNDKITADMVTVKNAADAQDASFKFLTLEDLGEVATEKEDAPYILNAPVDATGFHGDLYLQSRISGLVTLNSGVTVNFVANVAGEETTAYPYNFTGAINPIKKHGPGMFLVPSSMYNVPFNIQDGLIRYNNEESATLSGVLSGAGKVVKSGTGTLTMNVANTFTGGTIINGGTVVLGAQNALGGSGKVVAVNNGGALDVNGKENHGLVLTLNGGTLKNSGTSVSRGNVQFNSISLDKDSVADLAADTGIIYSGWNATTLTLNNHTLTKRGVGDLLLCNVTADTGTIRIENGGIHVTGKNANYSDGNSNLSNVSLEIVGEGTQFKGNFAQTYKNLTFVENGSITQADGSTSTITITDKISGSSSIPNLTLSDDATVETTSGITVTGALTLGTSLKVKAVVDTTVFTLGDDVQAPASLPSVVLVDEDGTEHATGYHLHQYGRAIKVIADRAQAGDVYATNHDWDTFKLANGQLTELLEGDVVVIKYSVFEDSQRWNIPAGDAAISGHKVKVDFAGDSSNNAATLSGNIANKTITVATGTVLFLRGDQTIGADVTFEAEGTGRMKVTAGVTISGAVTITAPLTVEDSNNGEDSSGRFTLSEGAKLTVPAAFDANRIVSGVSGKSVAVNKIGDKAIYTLWDGETAPAIDIPEGTTSVQIVPGQTVSYEGDTAPATITIVAPISNDGTTVDITQYFDITTADGAITVTLKDNETTQPAVTTMAAPTEEETDKVQFTISNPIPGLFYAVSSCDTPNGDFTSAIGDQATSAASKTVSIPMEFSTGKKVKYYKVSVKATK